MKIRLRPCLFSIMGFLLLFAVIMRLSLDTSTKAGELRSTPAHNHPAGANWIASASQDYPGRQWVESEEGWSGRWERAGDTNEFGAEWFLGDSGHVTSTLHITWTGSGYSIRRDVGSDCYSCNYTGQLTSADDNENMAGKAQVIGTVARKL